MAAFIRHEKTGSGTTDTTPSTITVVSMTIPASRVFTSVACVVGYDINSTTGEGVVAYDTQLFTVTGSDSFAKVGSVSPQRLSKSSALSAANVVTDVSGNTIRVRATGVSGKTINWVASLSCDPATGD
jgi:hypothetical protein